MAAAGVRAGLVATGHRSGVGGKMKFPAFSRGWRVDTWLRGSHAGAPREMGVRSSRGVCTLSWAPLLPLAAESCMTLRTISPLEPTS